MFLYMGDPPRDGIAEVLRCDSSSLALSLEESKLYLESLLTECNVDYLLKNQNAEVHRMWSSGQKGYWLPAPPVTTSPSPEQRESRLFSTSRKTSSRKPKFSDSIGTGRMLREEVKARHGRLRKGYGYHQWLGPGAM